MERSRKAAREADVVVFVADAAAGWTEGDTKVFEQLLAAWDGAPGEAPLAVGMRTAGPRLTRPHWPQQGERCHRACCA